MRKLKIHSTPTILIFGPDGREIDWHIGYNPPPTKFFVNMKNSVAGVDTVKSLTEAYARNPNDVETVFKLAMKYFGRFTDKAFELFREVVNLDPEGKSGSFDYQGSKVKYTEYAEYMLSFDASTKNDFEPLRLFVTKYPESPVVRDAYRVLSLRTPLYWEEYVANSPHDSSVLSEYLQRALQDKAKLDGAIELAENMWSRNPTSLDHNTKRTMAELYMLKDEAEMAELLYGKSFIDGELESLVLNLTSYADFWIKWKKYPERAEAAADAILRIMPENINARYQAARLYFTIGNEAKALEIFGSAFATRKWDSPADLTRYSHFWAYREKNLEHALSAAKRAVELDASKAENWHELAFAFWKIKDYDEAIKAEEEAIRLASPGRSSSYKGQLDLIKKAQNGRK
jgi:thioredoxin-like negative regulator of GroEL